MEKTENPLFLTKRLTGRSCCGKIVFASERCGSSSVVECHLAKVDVASPNLVYRSTVAPWPSGKAKLCKSFILQFDSGWRLQMKTQTVVWVFSYGRMRQSVACTRKRGFDRPSFFVCGGQRTAIEQTSIRWVQSGLSLKGKCDRIQKNETRTYR